MENMLLGIEKCFKNEKCDLIIDAFPIFILNSGGICYHGSSKANLVPILLRTLHVFRASMHFPSGALSSLVATSYIQSPYVTFGITEAYLSS